MKNYELLKSQITKNQDGVLFSSHTIDNKQVVPALVDLALEFANHYRVAATEKNNTVKFYDQQGFLCYIKPFQFKEEVTHKHDRNNYLRDTPATPTKVATQKAVIKPGNKTQDRDRQKDVAAVVQELYKFHQSKLR